MDINPNSDITLTTSKFKTEIASRIKAAIQSTANNNYSIFHLRTTASANVLYEYNWNNPDYVIVPGREVSCLITAVSQWNGTAQLHFTGQLPGQNVDTIMENWVIQ